MDEKEVERLFERTLDKMLGIWLSVVVGILICLLLGSCRSIKYVPVETVRTDTLYQSKVERDSIHVHDSVFVNKYVKGDTVFVEKEKWKKQYIERYKTDTLYNTKIELRDVPVVVEKPLSWWEKACVDYGKIMFGVSVAAVAVSAFVLLRRKD